MIQTISTTDRHFKKKWTRFLESFSAPSKEIVSTVSRILQDIRRQGDSALFRYTKKFDRFEPSRSTICVSKKQRDAAVAGIPPQDQRLLKQAASRIRRFHQKQKSASWSLSAKGSRMGMRISPLESAGLYVPGGMAAYPSSVLMNAIPAQVAGVKRIVMVTPTPHGKINPYTIAAAKVAGIDEIYRVGGAQAVAALAFGTQSIPAVDKIVGPGNVYVAEAKRQVFGRVAIDMIAGPSEVLILADGGSDPRFVASDLISQAEHDTDARPVLISTSKTLLERTQVALKHQLHKTARARIATQAIRKNGLAILAKNLTEMCALANEMAPEHLLIMVRDSVKCLSLIKNAGAIFIGPYTPVAAGDYLAGPNHVLPTARTARYASPLGVYDFIKRSSFLQLSRKGLADLSSDIVKLSEIEGLTAHGESVKIRLR